MTILLTSPVLEVKKINKRTQAKMFKNLKVGHKIQLSVPVQAAGFGRGTYASYIEVWNLTTDEKTHKSFNEIDPILDYFELEEV